MPRPKPIMKVLHNVEMEYPHELRKEIWAALGDISGIELWGQDILVAAFVQSPFAGKAIIGMPRLVKGEKEQDEDKWQSKCFMVVKLGSDVARWCDQHKRPVPVVGEWCWGSPQDQDQLNVCGAGSKMMADPDRPQTFIRPSAWKGWPCRLVAVADIKGRTARPQDIM